MQQQRLNVGDLGLCCHVPTKWNSMGRVLERHQLLCSHYCIAPQFCISSQWRTNGQWRSCYVGRQYGPLYSLALWDSQPVKEQLRGASVWPSVFPCFVGQTASEGAVMWDISMAPCIPSQCRTNSQWRSSYVGHQYGPLYSFTLWDKEPVELLRGNISMASYQLQALPGMPMLLQRMFHHHHVKLFEIVLGRHLQTFQSGE